MADAKIEIGIGRFTFSGEGSETWIAAQLAFVLDKIPAMLASPELAEPAVEEAPDKGKGIPPKVVQVGSLASYVKSKGGDTNQNQRFLATADWLRLKGQSSLQTAMISKALQDNHQKRLSNAADCLNKNVSKGLCEKTSDGFFITPEGLKALGHAD